MRLFKTITFGAIFAPASSVETRSPQFYYHTKSVSLSLRDVVQPALQHSIHISECLRTWHADLKQDYASDESWATALRSDADARQAFLGSRSHIAERLRLQMKIAAPGLLELIHGRRLPLVGYHVVDVSGYYSASIEVNVKLWNTIAAELDAIDNALRENKSKLRNMLVPDLYHDQRYFLVSCRRELNYEHISGCDINGEMRSSIPSNRIQGVADSLWSIWQYTRALQGLKNAYEHLSQAQTRQVAYEYQQLVSHDQKQAQHLMRNILLGYSLRSILAMSGADAVIAPLPASSWQRLQQASLGVLIGSRGLWPKFEIDEIKETIETIARQNIAVETSESATSHSQNKMIRAEPKLRQCPAPPEGSREKLLRRYKKSKAGLIGRLLNLFNFGKK